MVVRLRFQYGPQVRRKARPNRNAALAMAALISPLVVTALCIGFWKLAADVGLAGQFAFSNGLLSHWQVWFALAALGQCFSLLLNRYGGEQHLPSSEEKPVETILNSEFTISRR